MAIEILEIDDMQVQKEEALLLSQFIAKEHCELKGLALMGANLLNEET
jgi:hypothetical protein